jgi:hypothetical protein
MMSVLVKDKDIQEFAEILSECGLDINTDNEKDRWCVNVCRCVWKHQQMKIDQTKAQVKQFTNSLDNLINL